MNFFLQVIFLVLSVLFLNCCSSSHLSNTSHSIMVQKNEILYKDRAIQFVYWVQHKEVEKMLIYTSRKTIKRSGINKVRKVYLDEVIPKFSGKTVIWDNVGLMITDEGRNPGMRFSGKADGPESFQFHLDVFGENGELVIINIKRDGNDPTR